MIHQFGKRSLRINSAGLCPGDKFSNVNPAISGFAIINVTMRFFEFLTYISLGQTGTFSHFPEKQGQNSIRYAVLCFCCHIQNFMAELSWHELSAMIEWCSRKTASEPFYSEKERFLWHNSLFYK
jgi:hypothetical protein